jgi:hypothetical protein
MEMAGQVRKIGGYKLGRWVAKLGRWVASLIDRLHACYSRSLGSNPDISQKTKGGGGRDISKGVANTLCSPKKNIQKLSYFAKIDNCSLI